MAIQTEASSHADMRTRVAAKIAREVHHGGGLGETKLTKVTSLLHAFKIPGVATRFNEVRKALEDQGLRLNSGWTVDGRPDGSMDVRRTGLLELSVRDEYKSTEAADGDPTIQMSKWGANPSDIEEQPLPPYSPPDDDVVNWFNVDPVWALPDSVAPPAGGRTSNRVRRYASKEAGRPVNEGSASLDDAPPEVLEQRVQHVFHQLKNWCPGLEEEMIRDLLRRDVQPKVETYGDEKDGIRAVSAVALIAREAPGDDGDSDGVTEELVFQLVEIVVGPGWMVTCWHPARIYSGTTERQRGQSLLREPFLSLVRHRWSEAAETEGKTTKLASGELGILLVRSLVETYGASHRMMERWVESWEVDFYRCLTYGDKGPRLKHAAGEISNLLSMVGEFRRRLTAFEHARWSTSDQCWFPGLNDAWDAKNHPVKESEHVEKLVTALESTEARLTELSSAIRDDMDLLMLQSTAAQQESTERLQNYLGKVTGLVLVPTLVAGLFGANTSLPGGGSWTGFELMLILMVVSAVAVYLAIRRLAR